MSEERPVVVIRNKTADPLFPHILYTIAVQCKLSHHPPLPPTSSHPSVHVHIPCCLCTKLPPASQWKPQPQPPAPTPPHPTQATPEPAHPTAPIPDPTHPTPHPPPPHLSGCSPPSRAGSQGPPRARALVAPRCSSGTSVSSLRVWARAAALLGEGAVLVASVTALGPRPHTGNTWYEGGGGGSQRRRCWGRSQL